MKMPKTDIPDTQNDRKKRLAEALRQNMKLRKARAQAGETAESTQKNADAVQKSNQSS